MPTLVVMVLRDVDFAESVARRLTESGREVVTAPNAMAALDTLETSKRTEILLTDIDHGPGRLNGIALARMSRLRQPGIHCMFLGDPELAHHVGDLGLWLAPSATVGQICRVVASLFNESMTKRHEIETEARIAQLTAIVARLEAQPLRSELLQVSRQLLDIIRRSSELGTARQELFRGLESMALGLPARRIGTG